MAKKERKNNERFKYIVLPKRPLVEALKLKKKNKSKKYSLKEYNIRNIIGTDTHFLRQLIFYF